MAHVDSFSGSYYRLRAEITEHPHDHVALDPSDHGAILNQLTEHSTRNPPLLLKVDTVYCHPQPDSSLPRHHLALPADLLDDTTITTTPTEREVLVAKPGTAETLLALLNPRQSVAQTPTHSA